MTIAKRVRGALALAAVLALGPGCGFFSVGNGGTTTPTTPTTVTPTIYAVDTNSGKVYQIDDSTSPATAAATPLVTIGQNASGEITFYSGTAYVAVASYNNTAPGLYYFDTTTSSPVATRIGASLSVQYVCVLSSSLGYATVADYSNPTSNGLYSFNPSSPSSGLTKVVGSTDLSYPQDLVYGSDGYLYVAEDAGVLSYDYTAGKVLKVNPSSGAIVATYATTLGGTTGLRAGTYNGSTGIFVANTGGYDASYNQVSGSIDFIPYGLSSGGAVSSVLTGLPASRIGVFSTGAIIVSGGYPSATHLVSLSGSTASAVALSYQGAAFGCSDVDIKDGVAYIPGGSSSNAVYAVTSAGAVTKLTVGASTSGITNVGVND